MSEGKRSFFATIPGFVTGLAGLLTGIVGLVTVLIQLGVLGGDDGTDGTTATTTTVVGGNPASGAGGTAGGAGGGATTVAGRLTVEPSPIRLEPTEREKAVTVRNTSTATVTVLKPQYTGADRSAFSVDGGCTNVALRPGASCTVKVVLTPSGPLKRYSASLVVEGRELSQVTEVPVEASTLL
jgi:hypothetical protein